MRKRINSHGSSKKKSTTKALMQILKEDKLLFASFFIGVMLVLIIGSSFAWSSYSSWVKNHMQSKTGTLEIKVIEDFEPDSIFDAGKPVTKKVNVRNVSDESAIVRVEFDESVATFKLDEATGMLQKTEKGAKDTVVSKSDVSTWKKGNIYLGQLEKENYYTIDNSEINYQYKFQEQNKRPDLLKPYSLIFSNGLKAQPDTTIDKAYWIYKDGFFYYSKVLNANEMSEINVLEAVNVLREYLTNDTKNKLYKIDVVAYGVKANLSSLEKWTSDQALIDMYKMDGKFEK